MKTSLNKLVFALLIWSNSVAFTVAQQQDRLRIDSTETNNRLLEITGIVTKQNKYSIDIEVNGKTENVQIDTQTQFILELASPRIDFKGSKIRVPVRKAQRQFREYSITLPVFIRATFAHKNQYNRFKNSKEKRIGNYEISATPLESDSNDKNPLYITGKLNSGTNDRNIVLESGDEKLNVMLAKNGKWSGFSLTEITAGNTETRIVASKNRLEEIVARKIYFWPIKEIENSQRDPKN